MLYFQIGIFMKNQINIASQNSQQVSQDLQNSEVITPPKRKINYWMISSIAMAVLLVIVSAVFFLRFRLQKQMNSQQQVNNELAQSGSGLSSKDEFVNWKIYTDNKYGFEFKYPPEITLENGKDETSGKQYLYLRGYGSLKITPEQQGLGFENPNAEITSQPLMVNGKQVLLGGNIIEKTKIVEKFPKATNTSYIVIIPYPDKRDYSIMANYYFFIFNGIVDKSSEETLDKILSTLTFFDPKEFSVLNPTEITTFKSKHLKLSFRYPSSWGQIDETLRSGTTGKRYDLTFNGNVGGSALGFGSITAGGRTKDFSEGRGGYIADAATGFSSPREFCDSNFGKQGTSCEAINQNIVVQLVIPKYEDVCPPNPGQYWFSKRVWVSLTGQEVDGFMLEYSNFWSKQFVEMTSPNLDCSKTTKEKFEATVSKISEKLKSYTTDQSTKANLDGFDAFVNSIVFN